MRRSSSTQRSSRAQSSMTCGVSQEEIDAAYDLVDERLLEALARGGRQHLPFHSEQKEHGFWMTEVCPGVSVGQKVVPLDSVGAYVPGGRAAYPSSALMNVIPAKVADVPRIVVCTPPKIDGSITPLTLVAADMAGADEIYKLGGAQAIAAMAFGTETIERVQQDRGAGQCLCHCGQDADEGHSGDRLSGRPKRGSDHCRQDGRSGSHRRRHDRPGRARSQIHIRPGSPR